MDQLLDNTVDTYWQSDGPQPHLVNIQFRRKTTIHDVCIYTDYKADESYTPNRLIRSIYLLNFFSFCFSSFTIENYFSNIYESQVPHVNQPKYAYKYCEKYNIYFYILVSNACYIHLFSPQNFSESWNSL